MAKFALWRKRISPGSGSSSPLPIRLPGSRLGRQEHFLPASPTILPLHASAMVEGNPARLEKG